MLGELYLNRRSERAGRLIDGEGGGSMEKFRARCGETGLD